MAQQDALREVFEGNVAAGTSLSGPIKKVPYPRYDTNSPNNVDGNPYYLTDQVKDASGKQIGWNHSLYGSGLRYPRNSYSVLNNCVGYAFGRFAEIIGEANGTKMDGTRKTLRYAWSGSPSASWLTSARNLGLTVSQTPGPGALMVFQGHVEVVEDVSDYPTIYTSSSGYSEGRISIGKCVRRLTGNAGRDSTISDWTSSYWHGSRCLGFILSPGYSYQVPVSYGGPISESDLQQEIVNFPIYADTISYKNVEETVTRSAVLTAEEGQLNKTSNLSLLSVPTHVEAPFVTVRIGEYTLGTYIKSKTNLNTSRVQYPNFVNGIKVKKVNGAVNQYTINLVYQIRPGQDPNFLDKVFGSISKTRLIYISYGDWNAPSFIYKEEEALIIDIKTGVDFGSSRITYTVSAVSTSAKVIGSSEYFPPVKAKPSDKIKEILYNNKYGLLDVFYGMKNRTQVENLGLIASNDQVVQIEEKRGTDVLSYLNYLVSCMISINDNKSTDVLKSSNYYLTVEDDILSNMGGPYFTVKEVKANSTVINTIDTYELDVGFPTQNMVENFTIMQDELWSILYNYSSEIDPSNYAYSIDNQGNIITEFSPSLMTSATKNRVTPAIKNWWTQMTKFPISASITIKGLLRPAVLMSYVRINSMFYGQRHVSSGLYVITGQEDTVDAKGYRTTLTLQRIGGDEDYIGRVTETVTRSYPVLESKVMQGSKVISDFNMTNPFNWSKGESWSDFVERTTTQAVQATSKTLKDTLVDKYGWDNKSAYDYAKQQWEMSGINKQFPSYEEWLAEGNNSAMGQTSIPQTNSSSR